MQGRAHLRERPLCLSRCAGWSSGSVDGCRGWDGRHFARFDHGGPSIDRHTAFPSAGDSSRPRRRSVGPAPGCSESCLGGPTSRGFLVEVGGFGFRIHDGSSEALGGGLEAGVPLSRWLAIAAWLEGSGQREPDSLYGATYRLFDVGLGLTVGTTVGRMLADVSLVPELTRATVEEGTLSEMRSEHHLWGAALGARLRIGLPLRAWCPFIFVEASHAVWAESYTAYYIHVFNGTLKLPPANGSLGLGFELLRHAQLGFATPPVK